MQKYVLTVLLGIISVVAAAAAGTPTFQVLVVTNGPGTVSPEVNGQSFASGKSLTLTARPGTGAWFVGWTGSVVSTNPVLRVTVRSNLQLNATFALNPFYPVAGTYQGLFSTPAVSPASSGFLTASPSTKGAYTAKLQLAGKTYSFSGQFANSGWASNRVSVSKSNVLTVFMQLDLDGGGGLSGSVSNGAWTAELTAFRSGLFAATNAGKFTLLLPGERLSGGPAGHGYGAVTLSTAGAASLSGALADGTTLSASANVSGSGLWPVYSSLAAGKGLLFGWLQFASRADTDLAGPVLWIKPPQTGVKYYPAGFSKQVEVLGSRYLFTNKVAVLNLGTSAVWFAAGNLPAAFTNQVALKTNNTVTCTNQTLKLTLTTTSGLYQGSVANPNASKALKTLAFKGAVFQKQNFGAGFFLGTNLSGSMVLGDFPAAQAPVVVTKGTSTTVTNMTLGSAGGAVRLESGPLGGLSFLVPPGALTGPTPVRVAHNRATLRPAPGSTPGPVFELLAENTPVFSEPVAVTIPFTNNGSVVPVPYAIETNGLLHPCQVTTIDNVRGTLTFQVRRPALYTWLLAQAPAGLPAGVAANSTAYLPETDGFRVTNAGSLYNPGGECLGFTAFAQWHFRELGSGLSSRYLQEVATETGGTVPGQSVLATRAFNLLARSWAGEVPRVVEGYNLTPLQRYLSIVNILLATRAPVLLYVAREGTVHSVLAYDYAGATHPGGTLGINDPNDPGASRSLEFNPDQPDRFAYGGFDQVVVAGDAALPREGFAALAADAAGGFPGSGAAQVRVTSHTDGQRLANRTLTLLGQVTGGRRPVTRLSVVLNESTVIEAPVDGNGAFAIRLSLNAGTNRLAFVTQAASGTALEPVLNTQKQPFQLVADVPAAVLLATLTWATPGTDLDFYAIDPTGDYSAYWHTITRDGGQLDYDNTTGFGPEHWTLNQGDTVRWHQPYRFRVHYYLGAPVTRWTLTVMLYEGTPRLTTCTYTGLVSGADGSANNDPTDTGASWADACTIVPVPATPGAQPQMRKTLAGELELTVPVPPAIEREVIKTLHQLGQ